MGTRVDREDVFNFVFLVFVSVIGLQTKRMVSGGYGGMDWWAFYDV